MGRRPKVRINIVKDKDGWIRAENYKPNRFDLVYIMDSKGKVQLGWWAGSEWDFGKKVIGDEVVLWKKKQGEGYGIS